MRFRLFLALFFIIWKEIARSMAVFLDCKHSGTMTSTVIWNAISSSITGTRIFTLLLLLLMMQTETKVDWIIGMEMMSSHQKRLIIILASYDHIPSSNINGVSSSNFDIMIFLAWFYKLVILFSCISGKKYGGSDLFLLFSTNLLQTMFSANSLQTMS